MLWLQSCIIVILIKAAISFTSFCSEYDEASSKTPRHLMYVWQRERERWSCLWTNDAEQCYCWNHFSYFSFLHLLDFLFLSLPGSRPPCPSFQHLLCLCNFLFYCTLLSLSIVREKNLPFFLFQIPLLGLNHFFFHFILYLFSDLSSLFLYSVLLRSETISRF